MNHPILVSLVFFPYLLFAEQTNNSTSGPCSPIPSNNQGIINIRCSGFTKEQAAILSTLPEIMNKILANQLDPKVVMAKLDEILANQKQQAVVIGEIQSKTWKRLSEQESEDAVDALKPFRGQNVAVTVPNQDPDRIAVAEQLALIFQKAQWDWQGINTPMTWGDPKATQPRGIQLHVSDVTDSAKTIGAVLIRVYGRENLCAAM